MEKITKKPVVFYDLETTGKDKDTNNVRIIELAAIKYEDTENWKEIGRIETRFNNGDVDMAVSIDDDRTLQEGKYTFKGKQSKDSYDGEYEATFTENGQTINVSFVIDGETLTLTYEDGTVIEFKERK